MRGPHSFSVWACVVMNSHLGVLAETKLGGLVSVSSFVEKWRPDLCRMVVFDWDRMRVELMEST